MPAAGGRIAAARWRSSRHSGTDDRIARGAAFCFADCRASIGAGCGPICDRAAADQPARTVALLTDIGNDLIYGSASDVLERHLTQCLTMLAPHRPELVITRLPLASIERLSALRYHSTRAVFFPKNAGQLAGDARTGPRDRERAVRIGEPLFRPVDRPAAGLVRLRSDSHPPAQTSRSVADDLFWLAVVRQEPTSASLVARARCCACAWPPRPNACSSAGDN